MFAGAVSLGHSGRMSTRLFSEPEDPFLGPKRSFFVVSFSLSLYGGDVEGLGPIYSLKDSSWWTFITLISGDDARFHKRSKGVRF